MRYRVELTDRPDGLYAVWRGQVFHAQRSSADGTVLLATLPGDEAGEDFDIEWDSRPAKVVPAAEAGTFGLQTHCVFDDELFQIAPGGDDQALTLRWSGQDEFRARQLGLVGLTAAASADEITALWQERHDFPGGTRPEPGTGNPGELIRSIARRLRQSLPDGWERVAAQFRQIGDYAEIEVRSVGGGLSVSLPASVQLGQLFVALRSAMYQPGTGTWVKGTLTLEAPSQFHFDYDSKNEPGWRQAPGPGRLTARAYDAELEYFPREREQVPEWLAAKAGLPLDVQFRQAVPGDKRQPLPPDEVRPVLDYLYRAPVVVTRPGRLPDAFAPAGPPDVPDAFHTDGLWIWPAAVPHYLRKYGLPPEGELLDRIRANRYRVPYLRPELRAAAEADVLGQPRPPTPAVPDLDAVTLVDRGEEPPMGLRAGEVLGVLRRRLTEYGIPESAYRIGEQAGGAWSLHRTKESWEVSGPDCAEPAAFAHVEEAARFLFGSLLLYPARVPDEPSEPLDWPILPLRGEPPLNFFRSKRLMVLGAETTVLRFGNEAGNLVHDTSTRFPEASLAPEREQLRQTYRVTRPLRVLTGVTLPWGPMPGGAVGYFLPHALAQHLEAGALERV
ncbi:MAG TPA: TNT domain-containing protein [Amycolatopsis sp.]|uniref:TNT domain-containing protein n=1 Tax=Amycolatopsis sp. TaxID=37632 RepID=UPI002B49EA98|nr:TNT domain-containing protein [Amycolatopsis sp.]HKS48810.1 TNT domain-containing protein [Amycolatopsis sp.]